MRNLRYLLPILLACHLIFGQSAQAQESAVAGADLKPLHRIEKYTDPTLVERDFGKVGYHIRLALRGWNYTPSSRAFGESVGINYGNIPSAHADAVMQFLARHGVEHVRLEIGWNALDRHGKITNPDIVPVLKAAKKHGLRVLVLLNTHEGAPTAAWAETVTLLEPFKAGDRSFRVSHEDAAKLPLFRSGFSHQKETPEQEQGYYRAINVMAISKWAGANGEWDFTQVSLSRPLHQDIAAGPVEIQVFAAPPFFALKRNDDGTLQPIQRQALHAWIGGYVSPLLKQLDAILGKGKYDVEVGNELMFGASWFAAGREYLDDVAMKQLGWTAGWHLLSEITQRTVDYVHQHHPGVEIVYGFGSQNIWRVADTEINAERTSRHFYINTVVHEGHTYWYPEQTASSDFDGINIMAVDMMPVTRGQFGLNAHSWNKDGSIGPASALTQTEGGTVPQNVKEQGKELRGAVEAEHIRAKWELRQLLFFANKAGINKDGRGSRYYMYTLRESDTLQWHQIALPDLFHYLGESGGVYPPAAREKALTAKTFEVIKRARYYLPIRPIIKNGSRALTVESLAERHNNVQIAEGPHGPLFNRDVVGVLPFQTGDDSFAVGLYVQTLNMATEYRSAKPANAWDATSAANGGNLPPDPTRFDMPEEEYQIRLGGLKAWQPGVSSARLVDLMTGKTQAVTPDADGTFRVKLTDVPRLLILKKL